MEKIINYISEMFEAANLSLSAIFITAFLIVGLVFIGISVFNFKTTNLQKKFAPLYLGSFLIIVASFIAAFKGYISW